MTTQTKNILVTGATGFLGKNIIKALSTESNINLIAACRDKTKLADYFNGEVREGDLRDNNYLKAMLQDVDMVCHAGTWAAMWNHDKEEQLNFYHPTVNLVRLAIDAGVKRFMLASTVVIADNKHNAIIDDFSATRKTGFWPHVDYIVEIDNYMKANADQGMQMVNMRLGHFIGAGNKLGLVPVLAPRLKTWMVPWLAGGKSRLPLISDTDLGNSFVKACQAENLDNYESFNICGNSFPSTKEVIKYIAEKAGTPTPLFSVPFPVGYAFAWMMEKLFPLMPGKAPFLTRAIVHLAEQWLCDTKYANYKLGFVADKDWQTAMDEALDELKSQDYPWPSMTQTLT